MLLSADLSMALSVDEEIKRKHAVVGRSCASRRRRP